jgi:mono/diheme cytochrome c family protein
MLMNSLILLVVVAIAAAVVWALMRARRLRPLLRWPLYVVGGIAALVLLVVSVTSFRGMGMVYAPRGRALRDLHVSRTPERVARGQQIAQWCVQCHSLDGQLPLSGGKNLSDEAHMPLGDLYTINLTPAGPLQSWTDGEIFRAIRDGADPQGRRLLVMSAQRVRNLTDEDIEAVIAYIRSQAPVQHETPPERPSFLTVAMAGASMLPTLPDMAPESIPAMTPAPTAEYGAYMVRWMGCDECHGMDLRGGGGGVVPKGPNLRSVKGWTRDQFIAAMRTGKTPFKTLDSTMMPWKFLGRFSDDDLTAIHAYLVGLD